MNKDTSLKTTKEAITEATLEEVTAAIAAMSGKFTV